MKGPNAAARRAMIEAGRAAIRAHAPKVAGLDVALVADVHVDGPPRVSTIGRSIAAQRLREALPPRVRSDLEGLAAQDAPAGHVLAVVPPFCAEHLMIATAESLSKGRAAALSKGGVA